jgi:MFS family permease
MRERWLILAVLTFARTAVGFQFQSVAAAARWLLDDFQMTHAALGTLVGLYLLPGVAVALPGGMLASRFGDKRITCIGLIAMAVGGAMMGAAENTSLLSAGRVLSGVGAVLFNVIVTKMVTDWFQGREIVTAMGVLLTSWPLGIAVALVVLPALAHDFSWPAAMYAAAGLSAASLALVALLYRPPPTSIGGQAAVASLGLTRRELKLATLAGLVWAFYNVGFVVVLAFGPEFVAGSGHSPAAASAIVSTVSWIIIPALPLGAWVTERIGRPTLMLLGLLLATTLAIWLAAGLGPSILAFVVMGLLFGPPAGLIMALPGEAVPAERRAVGIGIYFTWYYAGMGVLPALAGYARDLTGNTASPLWFAGAMLIIASLVLVQFRIAQARSPRPVP